MWSISHIKRLFCLAWRLYEECNYYSKFYIQRSLLVSCLQESKRSLFSPFIMCKTLILIWELMIYQFVVKALPLLPSVICSSPFSLRKREREKTKNRTIYFTILIFIFISKIKTLNIRHLLWRKCMKSYNVKA